MNSNSLESLRWKSLETFGCHFQFFRSFLLAAPSIAKRIKSIPFKTTLAVNLDEIPPTRYRFDSTAPTTWPVRHRQFSAPARWMDGRMDAGIWGGRYIRWFPEQMDFFHDLWWQCTAATSVFGASWCLSDPVEKHDHHVGSSPEKWKQNGLKLKSHLFLGGYSVRSGYQTKKNWNKTQIPVRWQATSASTFDKSSHLNFRRGLTTTL